MPGGSYARIPLGSLWLVAAVALLATALGMLPLRSAAQSRRPNGVGRVSGEGPRSANRATNSGRPTNSPRIAQLDALRAGIEALTAPNQTAEAIQEVKVPVAAAAQPVADENGHYEVPLASSRPEEIRLEENDGLISLFVRNGALQDVLTALAETQGLNIVTADLIEVTLNITLERVRLEDVLDAILAAANYTWVLDDHNILHITSLANATDVSPRMQGRRIEVFSLDYATAEDVNSVISGMLSTVGQSFAITSDVADSRRSREVLVVEDLPEYLERVREQIALIDVPPRQVLIHVYILQINLNDENRHGINLENAFDMKKSLIELQTTGFANAGASQAFFVNVSGGDLTGILELLQTTTDSKTLASPKILCLNGQTSRIQVGEQLGFRVTTTTETSTTESVEFLDVGVVLEVTPRISRDGRVMMRISPEVSSGEVSASTGLPEEATTELETDVLLGDNQGVVIGGLIQEVDTDIQSKVPFFGDLRLVGKLFQRNETRKTRSEIIIALLPRIVPYDPLYQEETDFEVIRTQTPLLYGPLNRNPRPWEPSLPDALKNPRVLRLPPIRKIFACRRCGGSGCPQCQETSISFERHPETLVPPVPAAYQAPPESLPIEMSNRRAETTGPPRASPFRRLPPVENPAPGNRASAESVLR